MSKKVDYGVDTRRGLQSGVDQLANAVKVTLGAKGRNVVIQGRMSVPQVTKDGVTVAREISLPDPLENMGAEMVKEVAAKAVEVTGDGTTTATVLAQAIVAEGMKVLDKKRYLFFKPKYINTMDVKKGIDIAVDRVVSHLSLLSEKVADSNEKVRQIATISANNDKEIGDLIARAMLEVSNDGVITVEPSKSTTTHVETVSGTQFINGLMSPVFVTNREKLSAEFSNPLIFFYAKKVASTKEILPVIELGLRTTRPLVIIAYDFEGEVLETFAQNKIQKGFNICPVRAPSFGEKRDNLMGDLALITGGVLITESLGFDLEEFNEEMFGSSEKITITRERTTIVEGSGSKSSVLLHIKNLKSQIENSTQEFDDIEPKERIAKMSGGVAVIYVGANSEVEVSEKKDRIDDALAATKAAIEEGVVAGGGVALANSSVLMNTGPLNKDQLLGFNILMSAIKAPLKQIASNAGLDGEKVLKKTIQKGYPYGLNVKSGKYENLVDSGVIDPVKVTRVALEAAASIASLILTTEASITIPKGNE